MSQNIPFVVYVHVEKAGGISINNMLHHHLKGYISPSPRWGKVMKSSDLSKIKKYYPIEITGIGGHRISSVEMYSKKQFVFSFVREPLSRLISHLNWQVHRMNISHSFESFIQNAYFQNFQSFRLTGKKDFKEAKRIIDENFNFIGLQEQYDLSINLLSKRLYGSIEYLNYEKMNETKSQNKTYDLERLSSKQIALLRKLNQTDIAIYKYIKEELFPSYENTLKNTTNPSFDLKTPLSTKLKRKASNYYLGRILQPLFMEKVPFGY